MKAFIGSFKGVWLGGFATVVAEDEAAALVQLRKQLAIDPPHRDSVASATIDGEIDLSTAHAVVVWDGDY